MASGYSWEPFTFNEDEEENVQNESDSEQKWNKVECQKHFLRAVANHSILFDLGHPEHKNMDAINRAWDQIQQTLITDIPPDCLEKVGFGSCEPEVLRTKLKNLKTAFNKTKKRLPKSGSG